MTLAVLVQVATFVAVFSAVMAAGRRWIQRADPSAAPVFGFAAFWSLSCLAALVGAACGHALGTAGATWSCGLTCYALLEGAANLAIVLGCMALVVALAALAGFLLKVSRFWKV